jgi:hypothetical protein
LKFMSEKGWDKLPSPSIIREQIMLRDRSKYEVKEGDSEAVANEKRVGGALFDDLMDLYTEILLPACAGKKLFHPKIRHFETVTECMMPGSTQQARIPCGTEGFTVLTYMNNHKKWNAHRKWIKAHPNGEKCPRFNSNKPDEHVDFRAKYSDSEVGTNSWGGWSDESKKLYVTLQKEAFKSREDNKERHINIDQECVKRLYSQFDHLHKKVNKAKKQKVVAAPIADDDEDFTPLFEV